MTCYFAIIELFCPATNTFITPNSELGFSLIELRDVFGLPILEEFYEEFVPLSSISERENKEFRVVFQQVFALTEMSRDSRHKFKAGTWIKTMLPKGPTKNITFSEDPKVFKKKVVTMDLSSLSPRRKMRKHTTSYVDYLEFLPYLERTCSGILPKRHLAAAYLAIWLSKIIVPITAKRFKGDASIPPVRWLLEQDSP